MDGDEIRDGVQPGENGGQDAGAGAGDSVQEKSLMHRTALENGKDGQKDDSKPGEGQDKDDGKGKGEDDPSAQVPDKPEGYDLTFAPETQVDTALLDGFRKTAKEIGLTQGQAQKLGSMYEAQMADAGKRFVEAQTAVMLEARKGWEAEITKSPTFEKDMALVQETMRQFGDQELYDLLDQTNLGSHPKMFAFMAKIGKALAEPGVRGSHTGQAKSAAEVLYPNMNK